jgi:integrase
MKFNPDNERLKRTYLEWEKEVRGKSEPTVNNIRNSLYLFEQHINFKNFALINKTDILSFKKKLQQSKNLKTGEALSKTYILHTSKYLITFFQWLKGRPGYSKKLKNTDIGYFNLSAKDIEIAYAQKPKRHLTTEQIELIVRNMPSENDIQKRDRAIFAFLAITACRIAVIPSLKLKHIFLEDERVEQDPTEVKTKNSKHITTFFLPTSDFLKQVVIDWVNFLYKDKRYNFNSPLFPNTKLSLDKNDQFSRQELDVIAWRSTTPVRNILKRACESAGFEYYNPHSFRDTAVQFGLRQCKTAEAFKAISQNLGHSKVLTTFLSYGSVDTIRQGEIIKQLGKPQHSMLELSDLEQTKLKKILNS